MGYNSECKGLKDHNIFVPGGTENRVKRKCIRWQILGLQRMCFGKWIPDFFWGQSVRWMRVFETGTLEIWVHMKCLMIRLLRPC